MKIKVTKPFAFTEDITETNAYDEGIHDVSIRCAIIAIEAGWAEKVNDLDFYKVRVPEYNEDYYVFSQKREEPSCDVWKNYTLDINRWNAGNVFNTREQVESYGAAYTKLKEIVGDWEYEDRQPYEELYFCHDEKGWGIASGDEYPSIGQILLPPGTGQRAIDEIGDDLHWFWRRRLL